MKQNLIQGITSFFFFLLLANNAWAVCAPKEYDSGSGFYACPVGINEPCGPNPGDWCCQDVADCSTVPAPAVTITVYNPTCDGGAGIITALGCLPIDAETFVNIALPWAIGIGAGIAFLLGIYGAMLIILSAGNPEKMQAGKELITSVIMGLLVIIFSVVLLQAAGVQVLGLFGF